MSKRKIAEDAKHGGKACIGDSKRKEQCNLGPCPGINLLTPHCFFKSRLKQELTLEKFKQDFSYTIIHSIIVVNCKWSAYSEWTKCSKSCGGGFRTSARKIEQEALNGGAPCVGGASRNETCGLDLCPGKS